MLPDRQLLEKEIALLTEANVLPKNIRIVTELYIAAICSNHSVSTVFIRLREPSQHIDESRLS